MKRKSDMANEVLYRLTRPWAAALALGVLLLPSARLGSALESGAEFLRIDTDARAGGMASAGAASSFGVNALTYNPAGLAALRGGELAFSHTQWLPGSTHDFIGAGLPLRAGGAWKAAVGVTRLNNGGIAGRGDDRGAAGGFSAYDQSVALGAAGSYGRWSAGGAVKYIQSDIAGTRAATWAVDLGARRSLRGLPVAVGVCVQNLGPGLKYISQRDPLPLSAAAGLTFMPLAGFSLTLDAKRYVYDRETVFSLGSEYKLFGDGTSVSALALRGGLGGARSGSGDGLGGLWSAGAGIRLFDLNVDYALAPYRDLGSTHRVTLKKKF